MAGATGLVGQAVLALLLADKTWSAVHTTGRRPPGVSHPKLVAHLIDDFAAFVSPAVDDVFIALGTTIKIAGSREAFRAVDFDAVLAVAKAARAAGARRLVLVSAMGANAGSSVFYSRTKGEIENAVMALGFDSVVIARPSLLVGDRTALQQPDRAGEKWALRLTGWLAPLLRFVPANYKPVAANDVALAMVDAVKHAQPGPLILLSGELQALR